LLLFLIKLLYPIIQVAIKFDVSEILQRTEIVVVYWGIIFLHHAWRRAQSVFNPLYHFLILQYSIIPTFSRNPAGRSEAEL